MDPKIAKVLESPQKAAGPWSTGGRRSPELEPATGAGRGPERWFFFGGGSLTSKYMPMWIHTYIYILYYTLHIENYIHIYI